MTISKSDIDHLYALAAFEQDENEAEVLGDNLQSLMGYVEKLNNIDTENVAEMNYVHGESSVMREDVLVPGLKVDQGLANAPLSEEGYFLVPKVIESQ